MLSFDEVYPSFGKPHLYSHYILDLKSRSLGCFKAATPMIGCEGFWNALGPDLHTSIGDHLLCNFSLAVLWWISRLFLRQTGCMDTEPLEMLISQSSRFQGQFDCAGHFFDGAVCPQASRIFSALKSSIKAGNPADRLAVRISGCPISTVNDSCYRTSPPSLVGRITGKFARVTNLVFKINTIDVILFILSGAPFSSSNLARLAAQFSIMLHRMPIYGLVPGQSLPATVWAHGQVRNIAWLTR